MRVPSETIRCVQTVVDGTTYTARKGFFEMPDHHARTYLQASEQEAPTLAGVATRSIGFRCPACRFGSYFATCSRCGSACHREVPDATGPQERTQHSAHQLAEPARAAGAD